MVEPSEGVVGSAPDANLRIETVRWNGRGRVALIGEIDLSNVHDAEAALANKASSGTPLTLDFIGLSYLDSQGAAMLFRLARRARLNGGSLAVGNPPGLVRRTCWPGGFSPFPLPQARSVSVMVARAFPPCRKPPKCLRDVSRTDNRTSLS